MRAVGRAALFASALATAGCSTSAPQGPACTNESTAAPYGDAGILPVRSLPAGYPCATGAVCYATIDDCSDWPDASAAPASPSVNASPFECDCPDGVWTCASEAQTAPVCVAPASPPSDAGEGEGGAG
ncbi:MAG: hypothetical protein ACLQVI_21760 [Polyangiaceae bacterium]